MVKKKPTLCEIVGDETTGKSQQISDEAHYEKRLSFQFQMQKINMLCGSHLQKYFSIIIYLLLIKS